MKIAIVTSTFPPYRGGMGNVAAQEARLLASRGHEITVFAPNEAPGVRFVKPLLRYGNAAVAPAIMNMLNGFDAVHLHYPFFGTAEWVALWKRRNPSKRLVITYHMDVVGRGWLAWIFSFYSRFVMPFVLRSADAIAVSSLDYAETSPLLKRVYSELAPKLVEIPFPAPGDVVISSETRNLKAKYFLQIASLDRAHYFKGVENLIRAIGNHELKIIGDGDMRPQYEALARELGVTDRVQFLGAMPPGEEYMKTIADARALVLASVDRSEAFGLVLLDALACGIPLIASNLPGVRTIASDDVALRVEPNNIKALEAAIKTMATDDGLHARLIAAIPEKIKTYSVDAYIEKLEKLCAS